MLSDYLSLILYFSVLGLLGWRASRRIHSAADFFTGGKQLPSWVAALSAQATAESAWLLLGLTGLGALMGFSAFWVTLGEVLGVYIAWFLMADRFKQAVDTSKALTVTDYIVHRFRGQGSLLRILSALILTVFSIIYISAEIDATGAAFEQFLGWNYYVGAVTGFLFVAVYCSMGGFLAVAWTDSLQGVVMFTGLALLPIVSWYSLSLSPMEIVEALENIDADLLNVWGGGNDWLMNGLTILGLMAVGLGYLGSPQIFSRFIAIRNQQEIASGRWIALIYTLVVDCAAVMIGILGRIVFTSEADGVEQVLGNGAQNVLSMSASNLLPGFLSGLYIAAVLAAIMSTISSLLIMASSSLTWDFYFQQQPHKQISDEKATQLSRRLTWMLAAIALGLAIAVAVTIPERTVFWFAVLGWSGIAAAFCPMVLLSLFWKGYSSTGAVTSMITGFAMVLLCKLVFQQLGDIGSYFAAVETLPPAFITSLLAGWLASRWFPDEAELYTPQSHLTD